MEWNLIEGDWERLKASAKRQWEKLTDEQLDTIAGKRGALSDAIREIYAITPETTERQVSFWQSVQRPREAESPVLTNLVVMTFVAMIGFAYGASALASPMSKAEYETARKNIESDFKSARTGCEPMRDNVKDICLADVNGRQNVALAELEAVYVPGHKSLYDLRIARAQADYAVAKERCDDRAGNARDVCLRENDAISTAARVDATAQLKSAEANETSPKARAGAGEKITDAPLDAAAARRNADYSVAREKCETFVGGTKDLCLSEAKRRYGKP